MTQWDGCLDEGQREKKREEVAGKNKEPSVLQVQHAQPPPAL